MDSRPKKVQRGLDRITWMRRNGVKQLYFSAVYKKPSTVKIMAWRRIIRLYSEKHGAFITVLSHCHQFYTVGFFFEANREWWFAFFDWSGDYTTRLTAFERRAARLPLPHRED